MPASLAGPPRSPAPSSLVQDRQQFLQPEIPPATKPQPLRQSLQSPASRCRALSRRQSSIPNPQLRPRQSASAPRARPPESALASSPAEPVHTPGSTSRSLPHKLLRSQSLPSVAAPAVHSPAASSGTAPASHPFLS